MGDNQWYMVIIWLLASLVIWDLENKIKELREEIYLLKKSVENLYNHRSINN